MSFFDEPDEIHLKLRDRINYTLLIENWFKTIQMLFPMEGTEREILEATQGLVNMIPDIYKDKQFLEDTKAIPYTRDVRPTWCGRKVSYEFCEENGIPHTEVVTSINPFITIQAVINLLDRRGMISQKRFLEVFTGKRFEGLDEGDDFPSYLQGIREKALLVKDE